MGVVHAVLLSATEAWLSGIRVAHDARGNGVGRRLTDRALRWARNGEAAVCRTLVHEWNGPSLGLAAAAGFEPLAPVRVLRPDPVSTNRADPDYSVGSDPDTGWTFWTQSAARTALSGLSATSVDRTPLPNSLASGSGWRPTTVAS